MLYLYFIDCISNFHTRLLASNMFLFKKFNCNHWILTITSTLDHVFVFRPHNQLQDMVPLPLSRFLLVLDYLVHYFYDPPAPLMDQVWNIFVYICIKYNYHDENWFANKIDATLLFWFFMSFHKMAIWICISFQVQWNLFGCHTHSQSEDKSTSLHKTHFQCREVEENYTKSITSKGMLYSLK